MSDVVHGPGYTEQTGACAQRGVRLVAHNDAISVSDKVLRIITSYTDYVGRATWEQWTPLCGS